MTKFSKKSIETFLNEDFLIQLEMDFSPLLVLSCDHALIIIIEEVKI